MMKHPAQPPETTSETTVYPAKDKKQVQEGLTERPELDNQSAMSKTHRGLVCVQAPRRLASHKLGRAVALAALQ